jgi:hypothetical protein
MDNATRDGNSTARDGVVATRWRWMMRNGESVTAMLARPVMGATKANTESKHKMYSLIKLDHYFVSCLLLQG